MSKTPEDIERIRKKKWKKSCKKTAREIAAAAAQEDTAGLNRILDGVKDTMNH